MHHADRRRKTGGRPRQRGSSGPPGRCGCSGTYAALSLAADPSSARPLREPSAGSTSVSRRTRGRSRRSLSQTLERYRIVPSERESSRHCDCVRREAQVSSTPVPDVEPSVRPSPGSCEPRFRAEQGRRQPSRDARHAQKPWAVAFGALPASLARDEQTGRWTAFSLRGPCARGADGAPLGAVRRARAAVRGTGTRAD